MSNVTKKIKVAYDISLLARDFGTPDSICGIARVYQELLFALSKRRDISLTATSICEFDNGNEDPINHSVRAHQYIEAHRHRVRGTFAPSFKSRLGLTKLYLNGLGLLDDEREAPHTLSYTHSLVKRRLHGLLYRLRFTYGLDSLDPIFDSRKHDVFHSPFLPLPPKTVTKNLPRIITVYDLIPLIVPEFVMPRTVEFVKRLIGTIDRERDWVTCISQHTKDEFCEYTGMAPNRVFVAPLAAAVHFYPVTDEGKIAHVRRRYAVPEGPYFLSLAVPQPRKNLSLLIKCFFGLIEEHANFNANLILAGSKRQAWLSDEIVATWQSSKHRSRVIFTDYVADENLAALYSGATAFVFPSLYEGFGLPPLEAMACGTPVISSNSTALPELVSGAGLMIDPHDADGLSDAMFRVWSDETLRQKLSIGSLARASQFNWANCAEQTNMAYRAAEAASELS